MTTKMLDEIGEALKDNGFVFMEFGNRHCTSVRDSTTNYGFFGVLRDNGAESDASERLAGVLVAIKKKGSLILSPGGTTLLEEGDVLYFVGDEGSYSRVKYFLQTLLTKDPLDY